VVFSKVIIYQNHLPTESRSGVPHLVTTAHAKSLVHKKPQPKPGFFKEQKLITLI
jgi:hypothetical protein